MFWQGPKVSPVGWFALRTSPSPSAASGDGTFCTHISNIRLFAKDPLKRASVLDCASPLALFMDCHNHGDIS